MVLECRRGVTNFFIAGGILFVDGHEKPYDLTSAIAWLILENIDLRNKSHFQHVMIPNNLLYETLIERETPETIGEERT